MEVHDGQKAYLIIQNRPHPWIGLDSLHCREDLNRELVAKAWLVRLVDIGALNKLRLSIRMEENLHQLNRRHSSAKAASLATGLTMPV